MKAVLAEVTYLAFDPLDILPAFYLEQAHNSDLAASLEMQRKAPAVPALSQEAYSAGVERAAAKCQKHPAAVVQGS